MKRQAIIIAVVALLLGAEAGLIKPSPGTAGELIKPQPLPDAELTKPIPESDNELLKPAPGTGGSLTRPALGAEGSLTRPALGTDGSLTRPAPGSEAGNELIKPAPGGENELIKPAPGGENELIKPAPGGENELIKPAPGDKNELIKPAPGSESELIKPAPGGENELIKPAPGGENELIKPAPGGESELIKPAPGGEDGLIKPAPGGESGLIKPAPGAEGELIKPAPGEDNELIKPLPGTGEDLIKPLPGTGGELIKPLPGTGGELIKPLPGTGGELIKPLPGTDEELIKPLPGTDEELIKPLPGTGGELIKPLPGTGGELIKPLPGTDEELIKPLPGTGGELIKPLPGTGGELIKPLPGTGGELIKPLPGTDEELIKPLPGTGGELIKPLPGTGGELIKPLPGTGSELIDPSPGCDLIKPQPLPGTDESAPGARKVLPHLVLSATLEEDVKKAEISVSSIIQKEAKLYSSIPAEADLALDNIYLNIDDDISVELTNVKLVNAPVFDVASAKPNLEFLNLGLDIELGTLQVGGKFEIISKNVLAEIPVTSSGDFILRNADVKATGKVGLSLEGDFFKTINYDVLYKPIGSYLSVSYESDNKRIVSGFAVGTNEVKVVERINRELKNLLNRLVKKRLDDILQTMPVTQLIRETRAAGSYRQHVRALRSVANEYVDEVLQSVQIYIGDNNLNEIAIPDIEAGFSKEILWITWRGRFAANDGRTRDLATLTRTGDLSLDYDPNSGAITVFGSVGLSQLDVRYSYLAQFQGLGPSGSVGAHVSQNSVFLKVDLVLALEPVIILQDFHVEYAKDIKIEVSGLGILDWLVSNIATWVVGLFNDEVVGTVDKLLRGYVEGILPFVDPNKYFG